MKLVNAIKFDRKSGGSPTTAFVKRIGMGETPRA
jgi:hypothetical protein